MVVGFHAVFLWGTPPPAVRDESGFLIFQDISEVMLWLNPFRKGWAGVELFLVISGFLIHLIYLRSRDNFRFKDFYRRRFWRIYPPYLIVLVALFLIQGNTTTDLLWHLMMVHNLYDPAHFSINGSFWSIALEVQLYAIYPLVILASAKMGMKRTFALALSINILLTILGIFVPSLNDTFWFGTFLFKLWYVWVAGALVAEMFHDGKPLFKKPMLVAIIAFILFIISDFNYVSEYITTMLATLSATALMDFVLHKKTAPVPKISIWTDRALSFTGMISYSLYLVHQPVLEYFRKLSPNISFLILALLISFVLAILCYHVLEKPSIAIGKRLAHPRGLRPGTKA
jgi:peptidoglycan/LPS O-acetylase OafA/YrhL